MRGGCLNGNGGDVSVECCLPGVWPPWRSCWVERAEVALAAKTKHHTQDPSLLFNPDPKPVARMRFVRIRYIFPVIGIGGGATSF